MSDCNISRRWRRHRTQSRAVHGWCVVQQSTVAQGTINSWTELLLETKSFACCPSGLYIITLRVYFTGITILHMFIILICMTQQCGIPSMMLHMIGLDHSLQGLNFFTLFFKQMLHLTHPTSYVQICFYRAMTHSMRDLSNLWVTLDGALMECPW